LAALKKSTENVGLLEGDLAGLAFSKDFQEFSKILEA
jgi:hypothetical protein